MNSQRGHVAPTRIEPAKRVRRTTWRDPRLWLGIGLVAGCVLLGGRLMTTTVPVHSVYVADAEIAVGTLVAEALLEVAEVDLPTQVIEASLSTDQYQAGGVFTRPVAAGEIVPRAAVSAAGAVALTQLSISVAPDQVPGSVRGGSEVDVYVLQAATESGGPVLSGVSVVEASTEAEALGATGNRQVVVAVSPDQARAYLSALSAAEQPTVAIVRRLG